jgi:ribosome-associated protein
VALLAIGRGLEIPEQDLVLSYLRSPGPGGQNVNKVSSAVELRFNVLATGALDPDSRARLVALAGRRVSREGWLIVEAHRHRSQERNRADALERLAELILKARERPKPRKPTRPSAGAKRRRLEAKTQHGARKRLRGRPQFD